MALAWVLKNIKEFGGDPQKVFVGGMSAGAYLALIVTMDKDWLKPYGFSYKDLAGIISISGQTSTHFYVAKELKLGKKSKYAPLEHLSKDLPPMLIIVGDASCDVKGRAEENVRMATRLHAMGHENVECHSLGGKDHSGAFISGSPLVIPFINRVLEKEEK
jgi:acetyl esterase/lipase